MSHPKYELVLNDKATKISIPNKTVLGMYEYVEIKGKKILARIDSGAVKSSIDLDLAVNLGVGPIVGSKKVRNVHGTTVRPVIEGKLKLADKNIIASFTLQSRKGMNFQVLIGQNILKDGFIIDPNKNYLKRKE
jgi:hypothetical protein